jgi:ABC-type antimicrobial peptide transport system permease subunit
VLGIFIGMIPVLGIVLTGSLAVYFYRRERGSVLTAALASRLGGAAGIVVFAINAVCTILVILLHAQQKCIDGLVAIAQRFGVNTTDPNFQAGLRNLFTPSGLVTTFIFALALASIGGALASLFMRPRRPRL